MSGRGEKEKREQTKMMIVFLFLFFSSFFFRGLFFFCVDTFFFLFSFFMARCLFLLLLSICSPILYAARFDNQWLRGKAKVLSPELNPTRKVHFVHIPKTGGGAFMIDAPDHLPNRTMIYGSETCSRDWERTNLIFFRDPISHVQSLYMECLYSEWGIRVSDSNLPKNKYNLTAGFLKWIHVFESGQWDERAFNCYNPINMQSRYVWCPVEDNPHLVPLWGAQPPLRETLRRLSDLFFIGFAEMYEESLCLLHYSFLHELPDYCDCAQRVPIHQVYHDVPRERPVLTPESKEQMMKILQTDLELVQHAKTIFFSRLNEVEKITGKKIYCPGTAKHSKILPGPPRRSLGERISRYLGHLG